MTYYPVISGPVALYNNLPIRADFYQPRRFDIQSITLGQTTIVTTILDMDYVVGQLVRLLIPFGYGSTQLNQVKGYVIALLSSNSVEIDIDSSKNVNIYVNGGYSQRPQIVPVGDIANGAVNLTNKTMQTYIPGSFINISP